MSSHIRFEIKGVIRRPREEVRAQFGDFHHHASHVVHPGLKFTVHEQNAKESRFRQDLRILGLPQSDELLNRYLDDGRMVTEVLEGMNKGFRIEFVFNEQGPQATEVHAKFSLPVTGFKKWIAPLFRMAAMKIGRDALKQDTHDLESGNYARSRASRDWRPA